MSYNKCELCSLQKTIDNRLHEAKRHGGGVRERVESGVYIVTPCLNEKIDSGKSHLQDLARWWWTSQGVDIQKISQFYWGLFEKTRFLCFYIIKSMARKGYFGPKSDFKGSKIPPQRCEFDMKHVLLYVGHMYKPFWTKKI